MFVLMSDFYYFEKMIVVNFYIMMTVLYFTVLEYYFDKRKDLYDFLNKHKDFVFVTVFGILFH